MKTTRKYAENGRDYVEESNLSQASIEVGQDTKGDWRVKSVKVFEDNPQEAQDRLEEMIKSAELAIKAKPKVSK